MRAMLHSDKAYFQICVGGAVPTYVENFFTGIRNVLV